MYSIICKKIFIFLHQNFATIFIRRISAVFLGNFCKSIPKIAVFWKCLRAIFPQIAVYASSPPFPLLFARLVVNMLINELFCFDSVNIVMYTMASTTVNAARIIHMWLSLNVLPNASKVMEYDFSTCAMAAGDICAILLKAPLINRLRIIPAE